MTEHTCSTCRWWNGPFGDPGDSMSGECLAVDHADSLAKLVSTKEVVKASEEFILKTHMCFGCNQWEEKE